MTMPQYMLLLHDVPADTGRSPRQVGAPVRRNIDWIEDLKRRGLYVASFNLSRSGGRRLKPEGGRPVASDAVYPDGESVIGGIFIVEAEDITAAEWIARESPHLRGRNFIEIRAVGNDVRDAPLHETAMRRAL
jgi:hypothetical protein